jgi:hypothetical protein
MSQKKKYNCEEPKSNFIQGEHCFRSWDNFYQTKKFTITFFLEVCVARGFLIGIQRKGRKQTGSLFKHSSQRNFRANERIFTKTKVYTVFPIYPMLISICKSNISPLNRSFSFAKLGIPCHYALYFRTACCGPLCPIFSNGGSNSRI